MADAEQRNVMRPTPELYQHAAIRDTSRKSYNMVQDALDYYYEAKRVIDQMEYYAGKRLQEAFDRAGNARLASPSLEMPGGGSIDPSRFGAENNSKEEVRRCLDHIRGYPGKVLVLNVVCHGHLVNNFLVPGYRNSNQKISRLKEALQDVMEFYDKGMHQNARAE